MAGCCENGNEPSGYINCGDFFWISGDLLASQEGRCRMELVSLLVM